MGDPVVSKADKRKQPLALPAPSTEPRANLPVKTERVRHLPVRHRTPKKRRQSSRSSALPQWHVVQSIVTVTPLAEPTATRCMQKAHHLGRSRLLTTHRERAELYRDQFRARSLKVTLEPAESSQ
jgi:hypothetical protein